MKITKPSFIIDTAKCRKNIEKLMTKAKRHGLRFRPHFKTHQSAAIGNLFREQGVEAITVSSVSMAAYFAEHGWKDITIAFPVNIREMKTINALAANIPLNLLVDNMEVVQVLQKQLVHKTGIFIKIDTGTHRAGIAAEDKKQLDYILALTSSCPYMQFKGFLTHAGHTYQAAGREEIIQIHENTAAQMIHLKKYYQSKHPDLLLSVGDTPGVSVAGSFAGMDEIRPGNFVFYDVMQYFLGSCTADEIAVALACPVVSKYKSRNEVLIYGGGVHFSKEYVTDKNGNRIFGLLAGTAETGWAAPIADCYVSALSQEHGLLRVRPEYFDSIQIGDILHILPVHSCMTADLQAYYIDLQGNKIAKFLG